MLVTFLTPTYNRAYILGKLYDSLCIQRDKDFEWLIIDDGSGDETEQLAQQWKGEADFPIRYYKQENGGKHRALNTGIPLAQAPWIFIIDSDDQVTPEAMDFIRRWTQEVEGRPEFAGVAGVRRTPDGKTVGEYPAGKAYVDAPDIKRRMYQLEGDKAEVYRTDILRKYPFPEYEGEKFLSECAVWNRIGMDGYLIRWYPEALSVSEYLADGLTKSEEKEARNYKGYTYVIRQQLMFEPWLKRLALIAQYDRVTRSKGGNKKEVCSNLQIPGWELQIARGAKWIHTKIKKKG